MLLSWRYYFSFLAAILCAPLLHAQDCDILIHNATLVDGSGSPPSVGSVCVAGDRIVSSGSHSNLKGVREIDASGLTVTPGFIDPHTHTLADLNSEARRQNQPYLMQGVTTVITGNDGASAKDIGGTLHAWQAQGIGTNAALLVGQGTVRAQVLGMADVKPTPQQLQQMAELVGRGMADGAIGISTGLYYAPGSYSSTEEVIALAKVAAQVGGIYDTHLRDESDYSIGLLGSVRETIRIGREAGLPVHISHIKALGKSTWDMSNQVIEEVNRARQSGLAVSACQYPYVASGTSVGASLLPRWAEAGGVSALKERLLNPTDRARIVSEMERNLERRGGPESLLIISAQDTSLNRKTLGALAKLKAQSPIDVALTIIEAGDAAVASFNMSEKDLKNFMRQDWVMTCSDGSEKHPRKYGTFPRKLRKYVYDEHVLSLPFAVRSSTSLTAQTFHLKDRGLLKAGYFADITVFDPQTIRDLATFEKPEELATGIRYVLVNGKLAVDEGKLTGVLAGRTVTLH
jgi:N-acyl-D-aspartate/D-glutamate deacylase